MFVVDFHQFFQRPPTQKCDPRSDFGSQQREDFRVVCLTANPRHREIRAGSQECRDGLSENHWCFDKGVLADIQQSMTPTIGQRLWRSLLKDIRNPLANNANSFGGDAISIDQKLGILTA